MDHLDPHILAYASPDSGASDPLLAALTVPMSPSVMPPALSTQELADMVAGMDVDRETGGDPHRDDVEELEFFGWDSPPPSPRRDNSPERHSRPSSPLVPSSSPPPSPPRRQATEYDRKWTVPADEALPFIVRDGIVRAANDPKPLQFPSAIARELVTMYVDSTFSANLTVEGFIRDGRHFTLHLDTSLSTVGKGYAVRDLANVPWWLVQHESIASHLRNVASDLRDRGKEPLFSYQERWIDGDIKGNWCGVVLRFPGAWRNNLVMLEDWGHIFTLPGILTILKDSRKDNYLIWYTGKRDFRGNYHSRRMWRSQVSVFRNTCNAKLRELHPDDDDFREVFVGPEKGFQRAFGPCMRDFMGHTWNLHRAMEVTEPEHDGDLSTFTNVDPDVNNACLFGDTVAHRLWDEDAAPAPADDPRFRWKTIVDARLHRESWERFPVDPACMCWQQVLRQEFGDNFRGHTAPSREPAEWEALCDRLRAALDKIYVPVRQGGMEAVAVPAVVDEHGRRSWTVCSNNKFKSGHTMKKLTCAMPVEEEEEENPTQTEAKRNIRRKMHFDPLDHIQHSSRMGPDSIYLVTPRKVDVRAPENKRLFSTFTGWADDIQESVDWLREDGNMEEAVKFVSLWYSVLWNLCQSPNETREVRKSQYRLVFWLWVWKLQHPTEPFIPMVVMCQTEQGIGKTLVVESIGRMLGKYVPEKMAERPMQAKFNSLYTDSYWVFLDEVPSAAFRADSPLMASLKFTLTADSVVREQKGCDADKVPNVCGFAATSNFQPQVSRERRVLPIHCGTGNQGTVDWSFLGEGIKHNLRRALFLDLISQPMDDPKLVGISNQPAPFSQYYRDCIIQSLGDSYAQFKTWSESGNEAVSGIQSEASAQGAGYLAYVTLNEHGRDMADGAVYWRRLLDLAALARQVGSSVVAVRKELDSLFKDRKDISGWENFPDPRGGAPFRRLRSDVYVQDFIHHGSFPAFFEVSHDGAPLGIFMPDTRLTVGNLPAGWVATYHEGGYVTVTDRRNQEGRYRSHMALLPSKAVFDQALESLVTFDVPWPDLPPVPKRTEDEVRKRLCKLAGMDLE